MSIELIQNEPAAMIILLVNIAFFLFGFLLGRLSQDKKAVIRPFDKAHVSQHAVKHAVKIVGKTTSATFIHPSEKAKVVNFFKTIPE